MTKKVSTHWIPTPKISSVLFSSNIIGPVRPFPPERKSAVPYTYPCKKINNKKMTETAERRFMAGPLLKDEYCPSYEELTVPEIPLTSVMFRAGGLYFGKYCDEICKEYMLCKRELKDPRHCLAEGKEVTRCGFEFFGKVKKNCGEEFTKYWKCLDHSKGDMQFKGCRKQQAPLDNCLKEKMNIERPPIGYFSMVRVHKTVRPKPVYKEPEFPEGVPDLPSHKGRVPETKIYNRFTFL